MTFQELRDGIYNWARDNSGITVIWANENGPRPSLPYITLNIFPQVKIGQAYKSETVGTDGIQTIKYDEDVTVSIQSFGYKSAQYLRLLRDSLQLNSVLNCLAMDCLTVREDNFSINDVSLLIDSEIEQRWLYEVTFGLANKLTENVGYIEDVEYTKTIQQPQ